VGDESVFGIARISGKSRSFVLVLRSVMVVSRFGIEANAPVSGLQYFDLAALAA
jgi:hypothetical protein